MPINKGIFLLTIFLGVFFCNIFIAQEAGLNEDYSWDDFKPTETIPIEEQFKEKLPTNLNKVWSQGNGSCMPYARYRSGLSIYGAARTILGRLDEGLATATQPQVGAVAVTTDGGGHVSVVESISDLEITISEQNYRGIYIVSRRAIPIDSETIISYIVKK